VEQFSYLLPHLKFPVGFAHGPLNTNKEKVPKEYWDSDPNDLVKQFNEGKLPILIGTSCISTGTDIQSVKTMIYLMGGKSEIQVKQAFGRCTRIHKETNKTSCNVIDFNITNIPVLKRHASIRKSIYKDLYDDVSVLTM
jgi:superfamily II DNA or RNA helicase